MYEEQVSIELKTSFRGEIIMPEDNSYNESRKVYNAMIDKHPALIAKCFDTADIISAVNFARENDMLTAIRGGGHSGPGFGVCENGIVIDLSKMKGIRVDQTEKSVRVQGGCVWGEVDHATHAFGMATPSGFVSTTGVGGLTLGGGIGYLSRKYGLTIDNLLSVDVVLADGSFIKANQKENTDLFWAIRGGGGNFGVITSFLFKLHPVNIVYGGPMLWPAERAGEIMKLWSNYITNAPEDINGWFAFLNVPPGPPFPEQYHLKNMCAIVWCDTGNKEDAENRLIQIRKDFGAPAIDFAGQIPWPALQSLFDGLLTKGLQWYWKADFFKELNSKGIEVHLKHGTKLPTLLSTMHIYPINGAVHKVGKNDTAFSFRDANFATVIVGVDPDAANNEKMISWAKYYWKDLHSHSFGGAYINMIMDEGQSEIKSAYRDNYERLVNIKKKYDPANLFRINQNILPK